MSMLDILVVLADRKRLIVRITATFALTAIVVSLLLPNHYTATVTLLPPQQPSGLGAALLSGMSGTRGPSFGGIEGVAALAGGSLGLKNPNDRYVGMLKSRIVEDAVIQRFGLMQEYHKKYLSDARKKFESRTDVDGNAKDGLIHIAVVDSDPNRAAQIANGYVDQFRTLSQSLAITEASQRRAFFESQLEQAKENLANAEQAMKETEEKTGLIELDSQARALIQTVATLRAQIAAREMMIQGMQTYATGQNAQLVQAQQELDSLRSQLAKLGGSEASADGLIVPKGLVPQAGLEYVRKLRDVKYYETIFEILARQFELAKLDEAREGSIIQIVDPAMPPDKRSFPMRTLIVLGATFAGFIVAVCIAFSMSAYERMKNDPEAAQKIRHIRRVLSFRPLRS
jgi:uncharacterized protein involved in exopolysaccharide biosynthesis